MEEWLSKVVQVIGWIMDGGKYVEAADTVGVVGASQGFEVEVLDPCPQQGGVMVALVVRLFLAAVYFASSKATPPFSIYLFISSSPSSLTLTFTR